VIGRRLAIPMVTDSSNHRSERKGHQRNYARTTMRRDVSARRGVGVPLEPMAKRRREADLMRLIYPGGMPGGIAMRHQSKSLTLDPRFHSSSELTRLCSN
jgi:hypothetical protein